MPRIYYNPQETITESFENDVITLENVDFIFENDTLGRMELDPNRYYDIEELPYQENIFKDAWVKEYEYYKDKNDNHYQKDEKGNFYDPYSKELYKGDEKELPFCPRMIVFSNEGWNPENPTKVYALVQFKGKMQLFEGSWLYDSKMSDEEFMRSLKTVDSQQDLDEVVRSFTSLLYIIKELSSPKKKKKESKRRRILPKKKRQAYQELTKLCVHNTYQKEILDFFEKLKDYKDDEDYETTLNYVLEYFSDNDFHFIISLDISSGGEDLQYFIEKILQDNYDNRVYNFPPFDEDDAIGNMTILEDFSSYLNSCGLQIGFIDTESDEYVLFIHKLTDQEKAEELVNQIGYEYYVVEKESVIKQNDEMEKEVVIKSEPKHTEKKWWQFWK